MSRLPVNTIDQVITGDYAMYHGDCVEVTRGLPDNSIHYSIFSPPFSSLYTYSNSERDMGNSRNDTEFYEHFKYLIGELYRVTIPGRLVSFHCMNLPTSKTHHGYIGIRDFRGELIKSFQEAGWIYHSEVCIWKDPVVAQQRTKALGLLHKQIVKDSCMSRQGIPDYLVTMRKPGVNPEPVKGCFEDYHGEMEEPDRAKYTTDDDNRNWYSIEVWQRYASPVWMDIRQSNTLQYRSAREEKDERHICLARGSLVLTRQHGYIPIEDVETGDLVLTHETRWRPVIGKQCNGISPIIRTCAQGVADLRTTPDHKLWTRQGSGDHTKRQAHKTTPEWVSAESTLGSYLNLKLPPIEDSPLTQDEWWIIGRWLGDGHRGGHRRSGVRGGLGQFIISCSHEEAPDLMARLGEYAGHAAKITATQIAMIGLRPEVRDVLDRCGEGASGKHLPGEAVTLSPEKAEALLSGYLSADGHYVGLHDRWCASSVSRALLLGMAMVAQRARGVVASVYAGRPARKGVIEGRSVEMSQDWIFGFRNSLGYRKSGWIADDGAWKKVRKIESAGLAEVWDLAVAEDASFTAEGAVVHNCPLQLDVIARGVELWSNPGDIVFSPFAGIASEGYQAVKMGRRFVGVELKESYYKIAVNNLQMAVQEIIDEMLS